MSDPISFEEHAAEGGHARRILLRRLIDFIAMPASQVAPQDRSMGGDILLDMLFHATDTERMQCARRIASLRDAPRRLLRYLAQCNIDIARPLLEELGVTVRNGQVALDDTAALAGIRTAITEPAP